MGFEVVYRYHDKTDAGYDREETKTFKRKVGDPFEEVPMEKLAAAVMAQLARRDIWIIDAEVYELTKKQISFKETKGGLILKNKKYFFEGSVDSSCIVAQEINENVHPHNRSVSENIHPHNQSPRPQKNNLLNPPQSEPQQISGKTHSSKPVDWVVFLPELRQLPMVSRFKLTRDKKYPVYKKKMKPSGVGEEFTIEDDLGKEITVPDDFFVPAQINLYADRELGFTKKVDIPNENLLHWDADATDNVPDIRKAP